MQRGDHTVKNVSIIAMLTILFIGMVYDSVDGQIPDPYKPDFSKPPNIQGMKLVWNDEFNQEGKPNPDNWTYEKGFVRNKELQWYQSENANCTGGVLVITGKREKIKNPNYDPNSTDWKKNREHAYYTSACVKTRNLQQWGYGKIIVRARINRFKGTWPAIWTLGEKLRWPECGEIDILEFYRINDIPHILANFAWGTDKPWTPKWKSRKIKFSEFLNKDPDWDKKFHYWCLDWDEDSMNISLDNEVLNRVLLTQTINADGTNPFKQAHYLLLNLAIGANGGDPSGTSFPQIYEIDYARVYQTHGTATIPENKSGLEKTSFVIKKFGTCMLVEMQFFDQMNNRPLNFTIFNLEGQKLITRKVCFNQQANKYHMIIDKQLSSGLCLFTVSNSSEVLIHKQVLPIFSGITF